MYSLSAGRLLVNFAGDIASLESLVPSEWRVENSASEAYTTPDSWFIIGGSQLRVDGFGSAFAATFTDRFRKLPGSLITFANGSTLSEIPWSAVSIIS